MMNFDFKVFISAATAVILFVIYLVNEVPVSEIPRARILSPLDSSHHHIAVHQEKLGELYYQNQLGERGDPKLNPYRDIGANYPCLHGVNPIGLASSESVTDGHKFACGIMHVKDPPIVYSFGNNRQQDFEQSVLFYRPDSQIFNFDLFETSLSPLNLRDPKVKFTVTGLGSRSNSSDTMKLLHELMRDNNHTYIDILKIDIEGGEFTWLKNEPAETFNRIGQLLIEVHDVLFGMCY